MEIKTDQKGDVLVVRAKGELTMTSEQELRRAFVESASQNQTKLVIDMGGVDFVDSSGLGVLIWGMKNMRQRGGDVRLFGLTKLVEDVFKITQLKLAFQTFDTEREALANFETKKETTDGD